MNCPNCGSENKENAKFCEKCGYNFDGKGSSKNKGTGGKWSSLSTGKKIGSIVLVLCIGLILIALIGGFSSPDQNTAEKSINVSDVVVSSQGYGMYDLSATIVPEKDYDYLCMAVVFYDDDGAIVDKNVLVWNMNDIKENQTIKASGSSYVDGDNTPSEAEVLIFDTSVFTVDDTSDAIFNQTVEL